MGTTPTRGDPDRAEALARLARELRRELVRLGVTRVDVNRMSLEELVAARRRQLASLMQPGRQAGC